MGCDLKVNSTFLLFAGFNPRTHVGCDTTSSFDERLGDVSIHAPTWGATQLGASFTTVDEFQSTHPRGVRLADYLGIPVTCVSIHAPTWGATS